ncbi:hypothetical protein [Pseudoblastomonas halimionae]|uniref:Uncharacterized protein n=1 Tax=Alteriqipengyuania halimionae TaxID=1926630 RepID=A0A6I4U353_9SPHN|nr:hypothetical protein [Alteriqipengyuania halimionae]MXP08627.1 hypothetical protein [Alteriqipengyuania halimionae]
MAIALAPAARRFATILLPVFAIGIARALTFSDWAAANATIGALLFAWIVADSLALSTIAKAPEKRPGVRALLGAFAAASVVILLGAAAPVRAAIFAMPPLLAALGLTVVAYFAWSGIRAISFYRRERSAEAALGQVVPHRLAHLIVTELGMMHLALFRWNAPPDVPHGALAFSYHRYLNPMIATLLALQVCELALVHFFVMMWNPLVAWILLAVSVGGVLWLIALMKSFRIKPVLLDDATLRVRSGAMVDAVIPRDAIARVAPSFDADLRKRKDTLDTAILSAPNVCLELSSPVSIPTLFGGSRDVLRVAMRLEDSAGFLRELAQSEGQVSSV